MVNHTSGYIINYKTLLRTECAIDIKSIFRTCIINYFNGISKYYKEVIDWNYPITVSQPAYGRGANIRDLYRILSRQRWRNVVSKKSFFS